MNRIATALLALAFATVVLAATPPAEVRMPSRNGAIAFHHAKHAAVRCETCHGGPGGRKIGLTKESGHKLCLGCHRENKAKGAPVSCKQCHSGPKS